MIAGAKNNCMQKDSIKYLIEKYLDGQLTETDRNELLDLANTREQEILSLLQELMQQESLKALSADADTLHASLLKVLAVDKASGSPAPVRRLAPRWWAAASIIVLLAAGASFYFWLIRKQQGQETIANVKDIAAPKSNRATITLSNGQKIFLDSAANGAIAIQGNVQVEKLKDGKITYEGNPQTKTEIIYNTLYNPRGSKVISLTLSDGTQVWLNAESSLKYPVAFAGFERKVEITGEAYFEVVHNPTSPFTVIKGSTEVEVLGTHFNVNAYDDEQNIKVTLLEGGVKVSSGKNSGTLKPGQQAQISGMVSIIDAVDLDQVMAWKNERFDFGENTDLADIMRQVSRWYDVDIEFRGNVPLHFGGGISRQVNVSEVLKKFELTGKVRFKMEGQKIIVMPSSKE